MWAAYGEKVKKRIANSQQQQQQQREAGKARHKTFMQTHTHYLRDCVCVCVSTWALKNEESARITIRQQQTENGARYNAQIIATMRGEDCEGGGGETADDSQNITATNLTIYR